MKTYTYTVFLRHPETKEVQYGTINIDHDGYMDCHTLFDKLNNHDVINEDLEQGYTLIAMQIVEVKEKE